MVLGLPGLNACQDGAIGDSGSAGPPVCNNEEVASECDCGGVPVTSGYCCNGVPQAGACAGPPVCSAQEVTSECDCGGVVMTRGYCCDGAPQAIACQEPPACVGEDVVSECACGGVVVTSGHCCDGTPQSSPCEEAPPACAGEDVVSECDCGGVVVTSGHCCDGTPQSSPCEEAPPACAGEDVVSECDCGGVVVTSGHCCDGTPQSSPCEEAPPACAGEAVASECDCGGVVVASGYCCDAVAQSTACSAVFLRTFYVSNSLGDDSNSGTDEAHPWMSIGELSNRTFQPDDGILLRRGDTWSNQTLVVPSAGSAGHPITLSAYGNPVDPKPIITAAAGESVIEVRSGNRGYWNIDGLDLRASGEQAIAFNYYESNHVAYIPGWVIQNCSIRDGMYVSGPNTIIRNNLVYPSSPASGGGGGIIVRGLNADNVLIEHNEVYGFAVRGIWIFDGGNAPIIRYNLVHDISDGDDNEGWGIDIDGAGIPVDDAKVYGNHVYNSRACILNESGHRAEHYNNLLHDCRWTGVCVIFYDPYTVDDANINTHHNIIYNSNRGFINFSAGTQIIANNVFYNGVGSERVAMDIRDSDYSFNMTFVNNIIAGSWAHPVVVADDQNYWDEFDYNIIVPAGSEVLRRGGTSLSLSQVQALGLMTHGYTSDPAFVSATDFHLQAGSDGIDGATDVGIAEDYDGTSIPQSDWPDIGVYEQ